ncbi:MAG: GtrA family protein [Firmicutes bacterium]|nr:GtrA family protein [Bacillota bacterium]
MKKLQALWQKNSEPILYLVFGALTTAVNFAVYWPLCSLLHLWASASNALAWVVAVSFAFLTNKPWVFRSHDWSAKTVVPEAAKFVSCRLLSLAVQELLLLVTVDLLRWNSTGMWLLSSVMVIVLNYVASKLLVFKKKT